MPEKERNDLYSSSNIIRRMIWGSRVVSAGKNRNACRVLVESPLRRSGLDGGVADHFDAVVH
jgi:hypothetical protein